jgi:hypothetical protein
VNTGFAFVYPAGVAFEGTYMREKLKPNEVEFLSQNVKKSFSFVILLGSFSFSCFVRFC